MTANAAIHARDKSTTARRTAGRLLALVWRGPTPSLRARVAAPFHEIGVGASEKSAHERTKEWFRSSGGAWTHHLS